MQAFSNHSLKTRITINYSNIDIFNIYSSGRFQHITNILPKLHSEPNAYIAGDFNTHHEWWYVKTAVRHTNIIRNDKHAKTISDWVSTQGLNLGNTPITSPTSPQGKTANHPSSTSDSFAKQSMTSFQEGQLTGKDMARTNSPSPRCGI